jgi:hypothetical protein
VTTHTDDWDADEREALEPVLDEIEALRTAHASDPSLDLLRAARGQALPDDLQGRVSRRLEASAWSRTLVEGAEQAEPSLPRHDEDRILARLRREGGRVERPPIWRQLRVPALATAGVALIAVVVVRLSAPPTTQAPPASAPTVSLPTPAQAPVVRAHLSFDKPSVKLSPRALTYRGASGDKDFLTAIRPALDAFRDDDYARADREFAALAPRYPQAVEIPFYQGVARLFLNDAEGAATALTAAERVADSSFAPDIAWYRAVADERAGRLNEAKTRLDLLCRDAGNPRQAGACTALVSIR